MGERLRASTAFERQVFRSEGRGMAPARLPDWRAGLEWRPWADRPHYLRLVAADLLDQNRAVEQAAYAFFVRETEADALGRYVLLAAHWRL